MSTSKSKGSKTPRITVACNSCRSRKQKCSGNKPICTKCLESHRQCNWPEQLKRGPAKGYIEALERRLHETEHVLLRLLAHMSDEQLAIAVERDKSPFLRSGKNDAQYWRRYPMRTAPELREWQRDCLAETRVSPLRHTEVSAPSEVEADENSHVASESQQTEQQPVAPYEQATSAHEVGLKSTQVIHGKGIPSSLERIQLQNTQPLHTGTPPGPSLWSEAPSVAFQRQFLW
ncbi:hypothetical protein IFM61606_03275 [Aspergillus udagawae]|nr:hypothetical protein IFM51744_05340 [Aspergillus udagawae]GFG10187.1 hypothetical protein IFM5058_04800 [Aspergillus udagawae]GFG23395.1 hypothetical protein IFM61606_03275 [Aspergillus udagawae]